MDGNDKEKVFMLEQQNKALAKQYFTSQEENKQLKIENERHCNQIQELQGDCDSYQTVIQNLYSRIMDIIKKSLTQLGTTVSSEDCNQVLTTLGNEIMEDNAISSLLAVSIPTHDLKIPSNSNHVLNDEKASILLLRLEQMNQLLSGETPSADLILSMKGSFKNDILKSAVHSAYTRIQGLLTEIQGLQKQIKQMEREISILKTTDKPKEPEKEAPAVEVAPAVPIRKQIETMIDKHEENQDGTEELRLEITKLQMLLESRNEELNKAEKEVNKLEKELKENENRYYLSLSNRSGGNRDSEYTIESLLKENNELNYINEMEMKKRKTMRDEMDHILRRVDIELTESDKKHNEERIQMEKELEEAKQKEAQVRHEKEAYEEKLKRKKLFAELYQTLEGTVHKLYKVIKSAQANQETTDPSSMITILKDQLTQMSEAYKNYESVIHKTKKMIEFGDKKNDQLAKEVLELQKTIDSQKMMLERNKRENDDLLKRQRELEEENMVIRNTNRVYEENCNKYDQEMKLLKDEITTIISNEDNYERRWNNEQKVNQELQDKVDSLSKEITSYKASLKRSRMEYEHRLMQTKAEDEREALTMILKEMNRYKDELLCHLCKKRPKDCILSRCQHIFCRHCIDERINRRERKCPRCLLPFGVDDVKKVWIINDPDLYEELKDDK